MLQKLLTVDSNKCPEAQDSVAISCVSSKLMILSRFYAIGNRSYYGSNLLHVHFNDLMPHWLTCRISALDHNIQGYQELGSTSLSVERPWRVAVLLRMIPTVFVWIPGYPEI